MVNFLSTMQQKYLKWHMISWIKHHPSLGKRELMRDSLQITKGGKKILPIEAYRKSRMLILLIY